MRGTAAFILVMAAAPVQAQDPRIEPVLVELRLGQLAARTIPAHRVGDHALIPVAPLLELAELRALAEPRGGITAILQPGNRRVVIDPARRRLTVAGRGRDLAPGELLVQDGQVFLSTAVFTEALGIRMQISWSDLEVIVADPDELPIGRRIRRGALAQARLAAEAAVRADGFLEERRWPLEGWIADYGVLVPTDYPRNGAYNATLGFALLDGAFLAGVQNDGALDQGHARFDLSWTGVWRDNPWLAQLRLGDGFASGPRTRALRGVSLGNVPFRRPPIIGQLPFTQTLGPGWEVEAYRGGRLIAFDSVNALGQFSLDVPIQYGENPVDFIAYGPFGEVRQFDRTYRVSPEVIPTGRMEYAVSGGACRRLAPCTGTANADVRYGVSQRMTVFGGWDHFWRDTLPDLSHPYAGIVAGLTNAVVVEAEVVADAVVRGGVRLEPSTNYLLQVEATRFDRDVTAPILTLPGRRWQFTVGGQARPFPGRLRNWMVFDAGLDRIETQAETITSVRIGGSFQPGQIRFVPVLRWERSEAAGAGAATTTTWGLNTVILPLRGLGRLASTMTARSSLEFDTPLRTRSASAFVSRPLGRFVKLEVGGSWFRGQRASLSAFLAADLPQGRAYTTVDRTSAGDLRATQFVQGSVLYDASRREVALHAGPSSQQGGVSGRVFLDRNENGSLDPGEFVLPGVQVSVGIFSQMTDSAGGYRIWPIPPYDPVLASIDTVSLASPLWLPAFGGIQLEPRPNRFTTLNIPILSGGVVEGRVVRATPDGDAPVPGATLVFRHLETGRERRVTTFTDGSFYVLSVRPGTWDASVEPSLAARLGQRAEPLRFRIPQLMEGASLEGLVLRLR